MEQNNSGTNVNFMEYSLKSISLYFVYFARISTAVNVVYDVKNSTKTILTVMDSLINA